MPTTGTIAVAGMHIAYDHAGAGPALVLVHGAANDARAWGPQLDALANAFTVVAWDEPGAGRSSDVPPGFGLAGYADALAALIDAFGGPALVCGLSWGGTIALELYRRRPDAVAALVLADTYAGWKGSLLPDEVVARVAGVERLLATGAVAGPAAFPGLFATDPTDEVRDLLEAMAADVRPDSLRVALAAMADADLSDVLPAVAVPTLLLWGEQDARSPLPIARRFERAIPGAELVLIPGAGHMANLERPEAFNAAIRAFGERLSR